MAKKFISLDRLATFLDQIKILLTGKADKTHYHDTINVYGGNGVCIGTSNTGESTNSKVWINYRDKPSTSAVTDTITAITGYYFGNRKGSTSGVTLYASGFSGNAATASKATQDSAGQQINTTYIKALSVSDTTLTVTKGNGTTSELTLPSGESYDIGTDATAGIAKLYTATGTATDGTMTQAAITELIGDVESLLVEI